MRKYIYIFKSELMTSLQYVFNQFSKLFSYSLLIFIFVSLWKYIYTDPEQLINGYSINQMIWYVILTELLWTSLNTRQLNQKIVDDVKSGNIAYNITKPYNYVNYILASHFGEKFINFVVFLVYGLLLGFLFLGSFPNLTLLSGLIILISAIISMVINALITIIFGLFSFIIEDSTPLYWIYSKVTLLLGTVFPVEFFPGIMKVILKYSPIFAISYGSARLFVNFSWKFAGTVFIVQGIYLVVIYLITQLVYKKGVKNINVNGG